MSLHRNLFVGLIVCGLTTGLVACKENNPTPSQIEASSYSTDVASLETALNVRIGAFEDIFESGKISKLFDFTPPKVLNKVLSAGNVTRAQLDDQVDQIWTMTLQTVEVGGFDLDRTSRDVEFLDNGRPYKIIPTSSTMRIKTNGSVIVSKSETLALVEQGEWYIVRLDEPAQIKMFRDAYPDFDSVEVMAPVMTMDGKEVSL